MVLLLLIRIKLEKQMNTADLSSCIFVYHPVGPGLNPNQIIYLEKNIII